MKLVKVSDLKGNEKLAKHILTESGTELMAKGSIIKPEYIDRLVQLGIEQVLIDDSLFFNIDFSNEDKGFIKEQVKEESRAIVKDILEKHVYKNTSELVKLCAAADNIINDITSEDQVMERIINIRKEGTDIYAHSINVCAMATLIALKNNFVRDTIREIAKGCILHDIGLRYIVVPYENVDMDQLDAKERSEFRKHVILGYDALKDENWLGQVAKDIILFHHERNDGTGYPFKNNGNALSDAVKIVEVCDTFDCLLNGIGCKQMKVHEVVEYIRFHSLMSFDEKYATQLLRMVAMYPIGTKVITSDNEIGVVIKQNKQCIDRPVLKIITDKDGKPVEDEVIKDMTVHLTMFIVDTVE